MRILDKQSAPGRWQVVAALLRSGTVVTLLLVAYGFAPLDATPGWGTWLVFAAGLGGFAVLIVWQVHGILNSETPRLRGLQTIAVGLPTLLVLFAAGYVLVSGAWPDSFTEPLSRIDALYFALTVFATVGFGDIAPVSQLARILTMTQMVVGLIVVGFVAKVVLNAVRTAVRRRGDDQ